MNSIHLFNNVEKVISNTFKKIHYTRKGVQVVPTKLRSMCVLRLSSGVISIMHYLSKRTSKRGLYKRRKVSYVS